MSNFNFTIIFLLVLVSQWTKSEFTQESIPKSWIVTMKGETVNAENNIYKTNVLTNKRPGTTSKSFNYFYKLMFENHEGFMIVKNETNKNMLHPEIGDYIRKLNQNGIPLYKSGVIENQLFTNPTDILNQEKNLGSLNQTTISLKFSRCIHDQKYLPLFHNTMFSHQQVMDIYYRNLRLNKEEELPISFPSTYKNPDYQADAQGFAQFYSEFILYNYAIKNYMGDLIVTENMVTQVKPIIEKARVELLKIKYVDPRNSFNLNMNMVHTEANNILKNEQTLNLIIQTTLDSIYRGESYFRLEVPSDKNSQKDEKKRMKSTYERVFISLFNSVYSKLSIKFQFNDIMVNMAKNQVQNIVSELDKSLKTFNLFDEDEHKKKILNIYKTFVNMLIPSKIETLYILSILKDAYIDFIQHYFKICTGTQFVHFGMFIDLTSIQPNDRPFTSAKVLEVWKYYDPDLVPEDLHEIVLFKDQNRILI